MPTLNTPLDPVAITLRDGVTRHLLYSAGSLRRLKKKYGKSLFNRETVLAMDEDTIPYLIWEGLIEREGLADDDAVADLIDTRKLQEIAEKFFEAFSGSVPEKNSPSPAI